MASSVSSRLPVGCSVSLLDGSELPSTVLGVVEGLVAGVVGATGGATGGVTFPVEEGVGVTLLGDGGVTGGTGSELGVPGAVGVTGD